MSVTGEFVTIKTDLGQIRGKTVENVYGQRYHSFQGIPYAKPPIGELRFKPPQPIKPWQDVKDALREGFEAPQVALTTRKYVEESSEDCLFLNVYTTSVPATKLNLKPVMFFIHGGSFNIGSGNTDLYGPDYLVTQDVVLVTCNYRLGALGFLSLGTERYPGNYGLKDIVLALKWVQSNIANFGGNPENVTIFGESAGGAAVEFLMLSKNTKNLFHKGIAQSGSSLNPWALSRKPREYAFFLGELLGCKTEDDETLVSFLRTVHPKELIAKSRQVIRTLEPEKVYERCAFIPCVEPESISDAIITKTPEELYENGDYQDIPFMTGFNSAEGMVYLEDGIPEIKNDFDYERFLLQKLNPELKKEVIRRIKNFYFPKSFDEDAYIKILSAIYFVNGINVVVESMQKNHKRTSPTYYYFFTFDSENGFYKVLMNLRQYSGVCHCDELSYLFKANLVNYSPVKGSHQHKMIEKMTKLWSNFAKYSDPSPNSEMAEWKPIDGDNKYYLDIGDSLLLKIDLYHDEIQFWKDIFRLTSNSTD